MRQFVIDELSPMENDNIDSYLKRNLRKSPIDGVYWLTIPEEHLTRTQQEHKNCGPFYCSVELDRHGLRFELLIRATNNLHCSCIGYADTQQQKFILDYINAMLDDEMITS